jgi:chemotaxis protein methyltransferase CheR
LTVPETYFFRHIDQLHAFAEVALPEAQTRRGPSSTLSVLSVGCASGEEPYSLAMLVRECGVCPGGKVAIRALDVNPTMLAKAARGVYSAWALRETPAASQRRWFKSVGREFLLEESIRAAVTFQKVNLAQDEGGVGLWAPQTYDVIFCRNVLMYFTPDRARAVVGRLTQSLAPGGHLFLGHAETLHGLSQDFHLCHTHDAFYYQRKSAQPAENGDLSSAVPGQDSAWAKSWVHTIQYASDRIQTLTAPSVADPHRDAVAARHGAVGEGAILRRSGFTRPLARRIGTGSRCVVVARGLAHAQRTAERRRARERTAARAR